MKKILFFAEPHPLRNTFSEFLPPAFKFFEMASHVNFLDIEWRIFSNSYVLNELAEHFSQIENNLNIGSFKGLSQIEIERKIIESLVYPDYEDDKKIKKLLNKWDEDEIDVRNGIVLGNTVLSIFYESLLRKVFSEFQFTHLVLWSENGAARNFCKKNGISILHMELGPTRAPYQETLMIDPFGTNANASLTDLDIYSRQGVNSYLWASDFSSSNTLSTKEIYPTLGTYTSMETSEGVYLCSPKDVTCIRPFNLEKNEDNITYLDNYVIVSLQLTDDLNTINHSHFKNPSHFIKEIVPRLLALGFKVCIKRHPGAVHRIFNLVKELEAINYAKSLSPEIFILPSEMQQKDYILFSKGAKAVISINSSVCFESWIIGVPGLIFGDAIFNFNQEISQLSNDFLNGGSLIDNVELINNIKLKIAHSLNNYFIPNNIFVLSKTMAKIVADCSVKSKQEYLEWLRENIDIFEMLFEEKVFEVSNSIGEKPDIDYYAEMATALPNDNFYQYSIDDLKIINREIHLRGWVISQGTKPLSVFIEYAGNLLISSMTCRDDVKSHFPYVDYNPGFEIRENVNSKDLKGNSLNIYIYGSDNKCRCITVNTNT